MSASLHTAGAGGLSTGAVVGLVFGILIFLLIVVSHGREYDSNYRGPRMVIGCILLRTSKFLLFCVFGC